MVDGAVGVVGCIVVDGQDMAHSTGGQSSVRGIERDKMKVAVQIGTGWFGATFPGEN